MQPEYKAIIDQRRALLVERITWTKPFEDKLRRASILPRHLLDEIQRDVNHYNRTYVLLARLVTRPDQTVFQRFCDVLSSSKQAAMANLLLQDRDNIVWDFDSGQRIKNLEDYFNAISESLIQRLHGMEDAHLRGVITDELQRRVTRLSRFITDEMREHDQLRSAALDLFGLDSHNETELKVDSVRSDLQKRPYLLFDDALENARKKNAATTLLLRHRVCSLEEETERLKAELAQGKGMLDASKTKIAELEKAAEAKGDSAFLYLQKVIMEQDDTIAKLRNGIRSYEELVNLPRGDFIELLSSIRNSCPRANSLPLPRFTDQTFDVVPNHDVSPSDVLRRHLKAIMDFMEHQKLRMVQNSTRMAELDRERGTMKTLLNARGATPLPTVLSVQLKTFREQKFELSNTIKELRQQLLDMNAAKEELEKKVEDFSGNTQMDSSVGEFRRTALKGHRLRRRSAKGKRSRRLSPAGPSSEQDEVFSLEDFKENGQMVNLTDGVFKGGLNDKNNGDKAQQLQKSISRQTLISQFVNMQSPKNQTSAANSS